MRDVLDWRLCAGCGACFAACTRRAVRMTDVENEGLRPLFDDNQCAECQRCLTFCPGAVVDAGLPGSSPSDREFGRCLEIWEGWATDPEVRYRGSSGGVISALSLYCLEREPFAGIVHSGMDLSTPWKNTNYISRQRLEVLARTGARYSPSAPCMALRDIPTTENPYVFIGKPCDVSAVRGLAKTQPDLGKKVGLLLTFFCAGTPSTDGTLDLIKGLGISRDQVSDLRYRGNGWPGHFRLLGATGNGLAELTYRESWSRLTAYRPLRCNLCPDGLGRLADIACGDAWHLIDGDANPGRSLILVRTERGRALVSAAVDAGYLAIRTAKPADVLAAQANLLERRRTLFGRLLALALFGAPVPKFAGFSLLRSWIVAGPKLQLATLAGTSQRIVRRRWFRRQTNRHATARTDD